MLLPLIGGLGDDGSVRKITGTVTNDEGAPMGNCRLAVLNENNLSVLATSMTTTKGTFNIARSAFKDKQLTIVVYDPTGKYQALAFNGLIAE